MATLNSVAFLSLASASDSASDSDSISTIQETPRVNKPSNITGGLYVLSSAAYWGLSFLPVLNDPSYSLPDRVTARSMLGLVPAGGARALVRDQIPPPFFLASAGVNMVLGRSAYAMTNGLRGENTAFMAAVS